MCMWSKQRTAFSPAASLPDINIFNNLEEMWEKSLL